MRKQTDHKYSSLLTGEENNIIISLLGYKSLALATTVAELWKATRRREREWEFLNMGVLCFVKDFSHKTYYLKLLCPVTNSVLWTQEVYQDMEYFAPKPFLHTFEAEEYVAAFNFADVKEADFFKKVFLTVVYRTQTHRTVRRENKPTLSIPPTIPEDSSKLKARSYWFGNFSTLKKSEENKTGSKPKQGKKKKLSKSDISGPRDFWHVAHWTSDQNKSFEYFDFHNPEVKALLDEAGIQSKHLEDKATAEFISGFIQEHGGMAAVRKHSLRTSGSTPKSMPIPPPPPNPPETNAWCGTDQIEGIPEVDYEDAEPLYEPIMVTPEQPAPSYKPPPPPMEGLRPWVQVSDSAPVYEPVDDMEAHRENTVSPLPSREDVFKQIRQGIKLKPINKTKKFNGQEETKLEPNNTSSLADALSRALASRSKVIHSDSEDEVDDFSSGGEDAEWEA